MIASPTCMERWSLPATCAQPAADEGSGFRATGEVRQTVAIEPKSSSPKAPRGFIVNTLASKEFPDHDLSTTIKLHGASV